MYRTNHIFPVLPIKHLRDQYGEPTKPHNLETGTKPYVSNLFILLFSYVVQKAITPIDTKALNMCHQSQKRSWHLGWNPTASKMVPHLHN